MPIAAQSDVKFYPTKLSNPPRSTFWHPQIGSMPQRSERGRGQNGINQLELRVTGLFQTIVVYLLPKFNQFVKLLFGGYSSCICHTSSFPPGDDFCYMLLVPIPFI